MWSCSLRHGGLDSYMDVWSPAWKNSVNMPLMFIEYYFSQPHLTTFQPWTLPEKKKNLKVLPYTL